MKNTRETSDRVTKWMRWIARIWSAPIILYSLMMLTGYAWNLLTIGVADPYAVEGYPPIEAIPPILMFISILGLGIAWRWEGLGGAITLVLQAAMLIVLLLHRPITQDFMRSATPYLLSLVIIIPGILFLLCWRRSRRMPALRNGA